MFKFISIHILSLLIDPMLYDIINIILYLIMFTYNYITLYLFTNSLTYIIVCRL